jgi:hypothetical protein
VGDEVIFLPGSRRSGGFGISHGRLLAEARWASSRVLLQRRVLGRSRIAEVARILVPAAVAVQPDDRLLVVRGSGRALGFVARGPIYEEALKHPELFCFV